MMVRGHGVAHHPSTEGYEQIPRRRDGALGGYLRECGQTPVCKEVLVLYVDTSAPSAASPVILVHGSWHEGRCWSEVQEHLTAASVESLAPTLPGHYLGASRRDVTHDDYVSCVTDALDRMSVPAVLVGHSFGGSVISRVAEVRPERCHGLVYYSAFVPLDGERVADSLPPQLVDFLDDAAAASGDRTISLPEALLRDSFANTADADTLKRVASQLVPEPRAPIFEALSLPRFPSPTIPAAYIACSQDLALPPGAFHPGQSSRLPHVELIEIEGDHESLFTAPERLADALLAALNAIDVARRAQAATGVASWS
jgi:pimeloyl-ACP methyl ester carboxylesterase